MHRTVTSAPPTAPIEWESLLARAIAGEGIRPLFQPIVDLQRCTVVGYEALVRFELPGAPDVGPERWFHQADLLGLGPELDAQVLRHALAHRASVPPNCVLSLNVDPTHLSSAGVQDVLRREQGLEGLVIELTEHHSWDWTELDSTLRMLRRSGAVIAIDDAGAGHCGLQQILQVRPAIVKLDRSLIVGIDRDEAKVAMVEMMGVFSSRVDAWLLAEGIETRAEAQCLHDLGVPLAQGYFFGLPDEPWAGIPEAVCRDLGALTRNVDSVATLRSLIDHVEPLPWASVRDHDWVESIDVWKPVTDGRGRPVGVVDRASAYDDEPVPALKANIDADPRMVAYRIASASLEPQAPVVVVDGLGRYRGIVSVRRLLRHLADEAG